MSEAVLFGSYELLDRIAEGGMAEVWRARSRGVAGFEKTVVIKRVLPSLMANPGFAEMLVREAKIAALLSHPNIVQIFDLGEERGAYFIAMEHVPGKDLGAVMSLAEQGPDRARLSLPLKLWIVSEVAKALDYAHRRKGDDGRPLHIVHRDISPQNVLLGFEGAVKVADFGIARADQQELGRGEDPKVLRGKYAYMSPEQANGEPLDRRSDLFSLGIVLWELLAGQRLFRGGSTGETLERVRAADVPPLPEGLGPRGELDRILGRALARDRAARYASAAELQSDLAQLAFDLGAPVDESDLSEAMARTFPQDDEASPNKLSVDVLLRAYDDATALSDAGRELDATPTADVGTRAFPASRRIRAEARRVVLLAAEDRPQDAPVFEAVTRSLGGLPLRPLDGVREAVFGHATGGERAPEHAARAALELRRRLTLEGPLRVAPVPCMSIVRGPATVFAEDTVEPEAEVHETAARALSGRWPGEIRVDESLAGELSRTFAFSEGNPPVLEGFRAPSERDALALRRRSPLCGRREEVRVLGEGLARASEGRGGAFLIVGEPGSGKSRLVAELRANAAAQDVVVVQGAGDEAEHGQSYGALAGLFADLSGLEEDDPPERRFAKVERLRVLGLPPRDVRRVGELLGLAYPTAMRERIGRPRGLDLLLAARSALRALSRDRTVLLVLEDIQWIDDSTRQVLPLLFRGQSRSRVLTVLTTRPGAAVSQLEAEVLQLRPLSEPACGRLLAHGLGARAVEEELAARAVAETAGNPAWIEAMAREIVRSVRVEEGVASAGALEVPVTEAAAAAAAARLATLRPDERDLVRVAALFENGVDVGTLAEVHGVPRDVARRPIRRLLVHRLLVPAEDPNRLPAEPLLYAGVGRWGGGHDELEVPERLRVPGDMLRHAILRTLSESERRRLHGRAVAVLERHATLDDPASAGELAHHAARSVDRRRAPEYLVAAAESSHRAGDPRSAAHRFAEAAALVRDEALEHPERDAVDLALRAAEMALEAGDADLAERAVRDVEGEVAHRDLLTVVRLAVARARAAGRRDCWSDAAFALAEVSDAIAALEDGAARAGALLEWGRAALEAGDPARAAELLERAQLAAGDGAPAIGGRAWCGRALALARLGRVDEADQAVSSALAVAARLGTGELRHLSLAAMAEAQAARGALGEAAARWAEAAEVAGQLGAHDEAARLDALAAATFVEAGEEERAVPLAERAVREGKRCRQESAWQLGIAVQAALAVAADPNPSWIPRLRRAVERLSALGRCGEASHAVQMLSRAHLALSDTGAAARSIERAAELARAGGFAPMAERLRQSQAAGGGPA